MSPGFQELELLDKDNNPLTHAKYHRQKVREAGERERRPLPVEVPEYLEEHMREYLAQVSLHLTGERRVFSYHACIGTTWTKGSPVL